MNPFHVPCCSVQVGLQPPQANLHLQEATPLPSLPPPPAMLPCLLHRGLHGGLHRGLPPHPSSQSLPQLSFHRPSQLSLLPLPQLSLLPLPQQLLRLPSCPEPPQPWHPPSQQPRCIAVCDPEAGQAQGCPTAGHGHTGVGQRHGRACPAVRWSGCCCCCCRHQLLRGVPAGLVPSLRGLRGSVAGRQELRQRRQTLWHVRR
mmetsp:Transcript_16523/g.45287  ORF Transcript_16523/g.45287 Transcript_16523/m.45287 type:complete len:202 (-) Transcript_16523:416-1021(-)